MADTDSLDTILNRIEDVRDLLPALIAELRSVRSQLAESQRENAELKRSRDYWSAIAHAEQLPDAEPRP